MDLIIAQLDWKFEEFQISAKDKNFPDSYKNIFEYFDILEKQPDLQKIIEKDRKNLENKKEQAVILNSTKKALEQLVNRI